MKKEIDVWLQLGGKPTTEEVLFAKEFLNLPDSMYFLAAINGDPIGGTAIYRDRTRLAMTLVAARLQEEYRDNTPLQLFKASLPFFKTLSIRDVDVLTEDSTERSEIPFPLSTKLQSWARPALANMGFEEVAKVAEISLDDIAKTKDEHPIPADRLPNHEAARKLLWDQRKEIGLSCSPLWLALDMANARGTLQTYSDQNELCMAIGVEKLNQWNIITFFVTNPEVLATSMAVKLLLNHLSENRTTFSLVGEGQIEVVKSASKLCESILKVNELTLHRKLL